MFPHGSGNGFADDVILLTVSEEALQRLLDQASRRAKLAEMNCSTEKSVLIVAKHSYRLAGRPPEIFDEGTYLEMLLDKRGVQQGELVS